MDSSDGASIHERVQMSPSAPAPAAFPRSRSQDAIGHLVISRRESETVRIGEDVEVEILAVEGSTVRLRINAPKSVRILRGEIAPA
jgi:carbon storage regulator CsrA